MKSLRWRIALWFALSVMAVLAVFVGITHFHLRHELQVEKWERSHPGQPGFLLHGTYSDPEIDDISGELMQLSLLYALPVALLAVGIGYVLARRAFEPVADMNRQLRAIGAHSLEQRVQLHDADAEFRSIEDNLNALLARLDASFRQLTEFSAQVAHELRTPLTLIRLQLEEAAGRIEPGLAESLQDELSRLSDYVDQCLLLATAEQGRLTLHVESVPLRTLMLEMIETYELLARESARHLSVLTGEDVLVQADPRYLRQVLHNLLTNALRHGKGAVEVAVGGDAAGAFCRVSNVPADHPAARAAGTGLGLRIVRALAGLHPGLTFTSETAGGKFVAELRWR
jgi:signal transduction histidine kinase